MTDENNTDDTGQQTADDTDVNEDVVVDEKPDELRGFESNEDLLKDYDELKANQQVAPEDLEEYQFETVEGVEVSEDIVGEFRDVAKELGLSKEQYAGVVGYELGKAKQFNDSAPEREKQAQEAAQKEAEAKADEVITERKKEYGNDYDEAIGHQQKAFSAFGVGDLVKDASVANNNDLFKFAVGVGKALSEGKINSGDGNIISQNPVGESGEQMLTHKDIDKI